MFFFKKMPKIKFTVKLAEITVEINAFYTYTKKFFQEYLSDELPKFSVSICKEDIRIERKVAILQAEKDGIKATYFSNQRLEPSAICRKITEKIISYNVLLFHGAVLAVNQKAYIFTAKSGTGKTTHCRLWLKNIENCHFLNGDKPLLLFKENKVYVCGSPWKGKEKYGVNEILPLEAICFVNRDKENHIEKIALKDCFEKLIGQTHIPKGNGNFVKAITLLKQLSSVEIYNLGCNMEDEASTVSYNAMVKK